MRMCACRGTAGFAHVSCLAEQAKILMDEAEENNLGHKAVVERWVRWCACSLCEQEYHGVVRCALGWACWKTYVGRPEADKVRMSAMNELASCLGAGNHHEAALSVKETELSILRRVGVPESNILISQGNLAGTYQSLGRDQEALRMKRDVYSGWLKLNGREDRETLLAANNYASTLLSLKRFKEGKTLLRRITPVARRVFGESDELMLKMRLAYAGSIYFDAAATLDDLHEAVTTLEETERIARRVFGGAHPLTTVIERQLRASRATLSARDASSITEAFAAMTPSPRA